MSWLIGQFFPSNLYNWVSMVLQAIIWPLSVVVIAVMFRAEVRKLLERLVHLKVQDMEAQFQHELSESEELASHPGGTGRILDTQGQSMRLIHELDGGPESIPISVAVPTVAISARSPRTLIEESWALLALTADRAADTTGIDPVRALVEKGLLTGSSLLLFERLRQLRMQVIREDNWQPSGIVAERYAGLARTLAAKISKESSRFQ